MKIIKHYINVIEISDFAEKHDLTLEIHERALPSCDSMRFYAFFRGVETKYGQMLRMEYGNGMSPEDAVADYAALISNKTLVLNALSKERRVFNAPRIIGKLPEGSLNQ